jgi:hypothetical protein
MQHVGEDLKSSPKRISNTSDRKGREHRHDQRTSRTMDKSGREHRQSKRSSEILDKIDREHRGSQTRSRTTGTSDHKQHHSQRTSRTMDKSGREQRQSKRSSEILDKTDREHHGSQRRSRTTGTSDHKQHHIQRTSRTMDTSDSKPRNSQSTSRLLDRTTQKHGNCKRTSNLLNKSSVKDQKVWKGPEKASNIHRDPTSSRNRKSNNHIGDEERQQNDAPIPTIEDGDNRTKTIKWKTSVIEKEEGSPSKTYLTNKEKELQTKVMMSEKKSLIEIAKQIIHRPVRNPRIPFSTKASKGTKSQDNKDRPDDSQLCPRSGSKSKYMSKKCHYSKNHSRSPPFMEILYSDPPQQVSPLCNEPPSKRYLKSNEKSADEIHVGNAYGASSEQVSVKESINISVSKERSDNHASVASKKPKPSAKIATAQMECDQFDDMSSNAKDNAATSHHERQDNNLKDFEKPKFHLKNTQNVAFTKNEKIHHLRQDLRRREQTINDLLRQELKKKDSIINNLRLQINETMNDDADRRRGKRAKYDSIDNQESSTMKNNYQIADIIPVLKRQQDTNYPHRGGLNPILNAVRSNRMKQQVNLSRRDNSRKSRPTIRAIDDPQGERSIRGKIGDKKKPIHGDANEGSNYEQILLDCFQRLRNIEDVELDADSYEFEWSS